MKIGKKRDFNLIVFMVVSVIIAVSAVFSACKGGDVKLLESMSYDNGYVTKFEYDDQNRLAVLHTYNPDGSYYMGRRITYSGNDVVHLSEGGDIESPSESYERRGNTIYKSNGSECQINSDGYVTEVSFVNYDGTVTKTTYLYTNGNLTNQIALIDGAVRYTVEYKYDDKKSPFNCNTPKWFLQHIFSYMGFKNNMLQCTFSNNFFNPIYTYEYDSDGYPTSQTMTANNNIVTVNFTYRKASDKGIVSNVQDAVPSQPNTADSSGNYSENISQESKIMNGDLSDFAGTWADGNGNIFLFTWDRVFTPKRPDGTFIGELRAYNFRRGVDNNEAMLESSEGPGLTWTVGGENLEFPVMMFPGGVNILANGRLVKTDVMKDRIYAGRDVPSSDADFYYREAAQTESARIFYLQKTMTFNNELIPITVFYSHSESAWDQNKIVFIYDGITQTISLGGMALPFDSEGGYYSISSDDFNFDGFLDVHFWTGGQYSGNSNIFLYNPQSKSYSLNDELSGEGYNYIIEVNNEKQTIRQCVTYPHPVDDNVVYKSSEYKWENKQLKLIREEWVKMIEAYREYTSIVRTLQNDGTWTEVTEPAEPSERYYGW